MGALGLLRGFRKAADVVRPKPAEPEVPVAPNAADEEREARRRALAAAAIMRQRATGAISRSDTLLTGGRGLSAPAAGGQKTLLGS